MGSRRVLIVALMASSVAVGACGGGGQRGERATHTGSAGVHAAAAPTLDQAHAARGSLTVCAGKDTSGDQRDVIGSFNARFRSQGLHANLVEFPTSADAQRTQFIQREQAKSSECDVFKADTVFMSELVAHGWLLDMTDYVDRRKSEFIPSTLATVDVGNRYYGVPYDTDTGLLFYRTDRVSKAPSTWQEVYGEARSKGGIVYQGAAYEGLTCDYLELAFAAGGKVLSDDGKSSELDSPQNLKALQFMVDGIKSGAAPGGVTTYMEEESRRAFEAGRYAFMRNWPYAYALGNLKDSKVKGEFRVAPLPAFAGGGRAGILGGKDYVISRFSQNPKAAMLFIDHATSAAQSARRAVKFALVPAIGAVYDERAVKKALPFATELRRAVEQAKVRPVSPVYPQITEAIYKNVNAALSGEMSAQDALKQANDQINQALAAF